jgi:hypothetical protein
VAAIVAEVAPCSFGPPKGQRSSTLCHVIERLPCGFQNRIAFGEILPAPDGRIDIERVNFETIAAPADTLSGEDGRAGADEWIKDNIAAARNISQRVRNHRHRLLCRVHCLVIKMASTGCGEAAILPNIRSIATVAAQLYVVDVPSVAILLHEDELVLRTIKTSLSGVGLIPDNEIH